MDDDVPPARFEVRTFPSADAAFRETVDRIIESDAPPDPVVLESILHDGFPTASVRERDPSAAVDGSRDRVWYAFRDGHDEAGSGQ
jgi:hypothetical protein